MKHFKNIGFGGLFLLSLGAQAASTSHLNDLIDMRASSGEHQLEERGYTYKNTVKISSSSITYWWSADREQCIAVTTKEGRYSAIMNQPSEVCGHSSSNNHSRDNKHDHDNRHEQDKHEHNRHSNDLDSIVGLRASSGESELQDLGYFHRSTKTLNHSKVSYWWNQNKQNCIAVTTKDGKYASYANHQNNKFCDDDHADEEKHHSDRHHANNNSNNSNDIQNLVGGRASGGERVLESHGYEFIKSQKGPDRIWGFWWNKSQHKCLTVVTFDGKYEAITDSPAFDCGRK